MTQPTTPAAPGLPSSGGLRLRLRLTAWVPHLPFPAVLLLAAVAVGLASGMDGPRLLAALDRGFGRNLGYLALLLACSFFLAAAVARGEPLALGRLSVALSPVTGAGLVCPDTSYATLSPFAGRHRRSVAVGSYAGFKLLVPAGPLIIAAGLSAGGADLSTETSRPRFVLLGFGLLVPVLLAGLAVVRLGDGADGRAAGLGPSAPEPVPSTWHRLLPLAALAVLLVLGFALELGAHPALAFLTSPAGALLATSGLAWALVPPEGRRACLDAALERTAPLLLVIGSAAALGAMLSAALPLGALASTFAARHSPAALIAVLFGVTALFKVVNGSSMATFAAVPPVLAPAVAASGLDRTAAAYAVCLGAFVAVLPNDSFFWLTQPTAAGASRRRGADFTLSAASIVQGLVGLAGLYAYLGISGAVW
jgi:gluconate:H+ symporter, GntP family